MSTASVGTASLRSGLLLVTGAMVLVACSGGGGATTGSAADVTTTAPAGTSGATTSTAVVSEPVPDEAEEAPTSLGERFEAALAFDAESAAVAAGRVLGNPDLATAAAVADFMTEHGEDLTDVDVWVLPIIETGTSLLVFDVVGEAEGFFADGGADSDEDADALIAMPWFQEAGIVEFVLILHLEDEEGPMTVTMSFPLDELGDGVNLDETSIPMQIDRG